jgi:hypothetical protein
MNRETQLWMRSGGRQLVSTRQYKRQQSKEGVLFRYWIKLDWKRFALIEHICSSVTRVNCVGMVGNLKSVAVTLLCFEALFLLNVNRGVL